ncbi:hypothetical protein [Winogradskyella sp. R77965]|uniref:hypothetical protein n=1 Tax=Winogradskyella sp. R77965 TaxID=3093872 RepID=UPI0037DCB9BD
MKSYKKTEDIVSQYVSPVRFYNCPILTQEDDSSNFANAKFRDTKYEPDYAAFSGRDLTPGNLIKLNRI